MDYHCPKCGRFLERTEADGLWCKNGCFTSEYELYLALQPVKSKSIQRRLKIQLEVEHDNSRGN